MVLLSLHRRISLAVRCAVEVADGGDPRIGDDHSGTAGSGPADDHLHLVPGLYLRAGAWQDFALPACGCDACEEDAEYVLRELAEYAEALTAGGDGWSRHGTTTLSVADVTELRARPVQPPADGHWRRWSPRH